MKQVVCFHCGYQRQRGDPLTHPCPRCRRSWRKPTLAQRIKIALDCMRKGFVESGIPKGYKPRVFKPKQATIMDYLDKTVTTVDLTDQRD